MWGINKLSKFFLRGQREDSSEIKRDDMFKVYTDCQEREIIAGVLEQWAVALRGSFVEGKQTLQ